MASRKKVSFNSLPVHTIANCAHHVHRTKEQLKASWYSREELMESCAEAKGIINIINEANGDLDSIDHSRVCIVGLEKFHGKKERDKYRKLLIRSVLIRQEMNKGMGLRHDTSSIAEISELISKTFKEFALWQAAMHKFHAYGPLSATTSTRQDERSDDNSPKRQKVDTGYKPCSNQGNSSPNMEEDPAHVRAEVKQLMASYCSR